MPPRRLLVQGIAWPGADFVAAARRRRHDPVRGETVTNPVDRAAEAAAALPPIFRAVIRPIEQFFRTEAAGGLVLLAAAAAALVWANLAGESYRVVLDTRISIGVGALAAEFTVRHLVNDGLMALFFFLVGMEIKRELVLGELRVPSQAALPIVAAVGGMVVPAAIYLVFNPSGPARGGWGIAMATDIAFAIGILSLLRSRVPRALVVFVTALAIVDDIGGILVIALFYGSGISAAWLAGAAVVYAVALIAARRGVRSGVVWAVLGVALWWTVHHAGVHATIAGVLLGLAIPARARISPREVLGELARHTRALVDAASRSGEDEELDSENVRGIERALEVRESPLGRFEGLLHGWVAFGVMPIFALANSGLELGGLSAERATGSLATGIAAALLVGKPLGIVAFALASVKLGLARLPAEATLGKLVGVATVAGIGFTVALFIAGLAFPGAPALLDEAKAGILGGSLAAGCAGALLLRATARVA